MTMLVSLELVKRRLLYDHDLDDEDLIALIESASQMVCNYLRLTPAELLGSDADSDGNPFFDSDGGTIGVTADIQAATAHLVGILKRDPSGVEMEKWMQGYLPFPVISMLYPLRDPALS